MITKTLLIVTLGWNLAFVSSNADCNPVECPQDDGPKLTVLPVPWDCKQYIMCQWGKALYRPCGFGLYYDHDKTVCMPPSMTECNVCGLHGNSNRTSAIPKIPIAIRQGKNDTEFNQTLNLIPIDNALNQDSNSTNNVQNDKKDESKIDNSQRNETTTVTQKCTSNSTTPVSCPKNMTDDRLMPHPDNCELFYYCVDSVAPICRECPANLHFNPTKKVCDFPATAGCKVLPVLLSTSECNHDPNGRVELRPNPDDCTGYYSCVWGHLVAMTCPANLHFNPTLLVCDDPEHAGCTEGTVQ